MDGSKSSGKKKALDLADSMNSDTVAATLSERVLEFVAAEAGVSRSRLSESTTLFGDLSIDGDDAAEFLAAFARTFRVDVSRLNLGDHFGPENLSLSWPKTWLRYLFSRGAPERRAGLRPVTVGTLIKAAQLGRW